MSAFKDGIFSGKVAFVAGGTSGINLGIARRFAELGARVAVAGRNVEKAHHAAASIGNGAKAYSCDVRDFNATRSVMESIATEWGLMDIVVSGAAGNFLAPVTGLSANGFRTVVDIDLNGTFNVFRSAYEFIRKPGASLIAITAGQAVNATMLQAHACAAKAGVNQLVRVCAMEWGPQGVRVNAISPGPIANTEGMARLAPSEAVTRAHIARIPLRRYGEVSEVAESAVFLCSSSANYITGSILDCEGGSQLGDASDIGFGLGGAS
jgi:NAD(P)-dependent dehydrogenase (short-subunit alcohol dehydrogenase family)